MKEKLVQSWKAQFNSPNRFWNVVLFIAFLIAYLAGGFCILQLNETKLDIWANKLNNYNTQYNISNFEAPIINVSKEQERLYPTLFNNFYYTHGGHSTIYSFRQFYDEESMLISGDTMYDVCINVQDNFSIRPNKYDFGYYIDYGLFSSYFCNEILDGRDYLNPRFGAKSFVFISDTLANKILLDNYLITEDDLLNNNQDVILEGYKTIITDSSLALIQFDMNGSYTESFSINNILYSTERNGPRIHQLYGDFCLCYSRASSFSDVCFSVELDLKNDIFENVRTIKMLDELGYNVNNSSFSIKTLNKNNNQYVEREDLLNELNTIYDSNNSTLFTILSFVIFALFLMLIVFQMFYKKTAFLWEIVVGAFLATHFLVGYFIFIPSQFNLPLLLIFLACFLNMLIYLLSCKKGSVFHVNGFEEVDI